MLSPEARQLQPVIGAPTWSDPGAELLREVAVLDENAERRTLQIPIERPLSIVLDEQELVTLMTLGARPELLTLGYLRNQRIIGDVTEIRSIDIDRVNDRAVVSRRIAGQGRGRALRAEAVPGLACGLGTEFAEVMKQVAATASSVSVKLRISRSQLLRILEITREYDAVHRAAGSVHGCALFRGAELLVTLEDVSRHNGLDTVTGWMMLYGVDGRDKTLFTTGRLTGEMVMKAAHNGISVMVSRNGVTSMGHDLAQRLGMVLIARAAKGRFLCYTGAERFESAG